MAGRKYHQDFSLLGRVSETISGASAGLEHGAKILAGMNDSPPSMDEIAPLEAHGKSPGFKLSKQRSSGRKSLPVFKADRKSGRAAALIWACSKLWQEDVHF